MILLTVWLENQHIESLKAISEVSDGSGSPLFASLPLLVRGNGVDSNSVETSQTVHMQQANRDVQLIVQMRNSLSVAVSNLVVAC